ncbi:MAG: hypothetical protein K2N94_09705, partial [Lachnospiraceae bacterium]|nr:hypothetical protein [Lachnospiraceae bacterium]
WLVGTSFVISHYYYPPHDFGPPNAALFFARRFRPGRLPPDTAALLKQSIDSAKAFRFADISISKRRNIIRPVSYYSTSLLFVNTKFAEILLYSPRYITYSLFFPVHIADRPAIPPQSFPSEFFCCQIRAFMRSASS